ncbi:MAG: ribosome recycling factor [Terracidiphilus sp.]|jgi:hypothetical protein
MAALFIRKSGALARRREQGPSGGALARRREQGPSGPLLQSLIEWPLGPGLFPCNVRRDGNDVLKKLAKEKKIREDEEKRALEEVQKMTDEEIRRMEELSRKKEAELMQV